MRLVDECVLVGVVLYMDFSSWFVKALSHLSRSLFVSIAVTELRAGVAYISHAEPLRLESLAKCHIDR